jgi:spectinomycin phosphotransferase
VKAPPEEFEADVLIGALADGWGFDAETSDYAAVGAGSYHWVVRDGEGTRAFVTVDDLDQKAWLGDTRDSAFDGLRRAFDTAAALRDAGLAFVVAPIRTGGGESVRRLGSRHTVALFPFVDGSAGRWGHAEAGERADVASMLVELHRATPSVGSAARSVGLDLPGRAHVESALRDADRPWSGGPLSEPARHAFARRASEVAELLALADRLAAQVGSRGSEWVVTHGEPHVANVMLTREGRVLVDWDTVALAPPERDLWMLVNDSEDETAAYVQATGHDLDRGAVDFYRLTWDLKDLAEYLNVLRSPHRRTEDSERAYEGLTNCVAIRDRWAALID